MNLLERLKKKIADKTTRYEPADVWYPTEQDMKKYAPDEDWR